MGISFSSKSTAELLKPSAGLYSPYSTKLVLPPGSKKLLFVCAGRQLYKSNRLLAPQLKVFKRILLKIFPVNGIRIGILTTYMRNITDISNIF